MHFFKDLKDLDYSERLTRLGLWSLEERRNRADLIEVFKVVNGHSALPAETFFKFKVDTRTMGHSRMLLKRHSSRDIQFHFFSERVINRWNCLLSNAVEATSVNSFKSRLDKVRKTQISFFMDTGSV